MEPARLTKLVRGDLDWIVMKSLEKDRTRRYETANGFARDVQRYLDGDPVEACPPSALYKMRKFARKHRAALATAGAFAFLLVVATAISVGLALWANRERVRAVNAENLAKKQQDRAEEREQMAIDAVKRFGGVVRETPELKNNPALSKLRAMLLKEPQAFFKRLREQLQDDKETTPDSLARLAAACFELGYLTDEIGDKQEAMHAYEESLAIRDRLARENPLIARFQRDLARNHINIGNVQRATGQTGDALASYEKARAILERLARENPSVTEFQYNLAASYLNIGGLQSETGRTGDALASNEKAHAILERLVGENPSVIWFQQRLAGSHNNIGILQRTTGRTGDAIASHEKARAILERLARAHPDSPDFASQLGAALNIMATIDLDQQRFTEARVKLTQAVEWQRNALAANPKNSQYRQFLTNHLIDLIKAAQGMGRADEATKARREIVELNASDPAKATLDARLAVVLVGNEKPEADGERLTLAYRAYEKTMHGSSARLYAEAFADQKLGEDRSTEHRYNAACAAALAGCDQAKDESRVDDAAQARWRSQARTWLEAELATWTKILIDAGPAELKAQIVPTLKHWKADSDLAGIRDEQAVAKLPESERLAFKQLWKDVDQLSAKAASK